MGYRAHHRVVIAKPIFKTILILCLFLGGSTAKGAWQDDANDRIEQFRKGNAEITVLGTGSSPVSDVSVDIQLVNHRFAFGAALSYSNVLNNTTYKNFVLSHFNWAVCENETKWGSNEGTRDVENYTQADYIYTWCNNNGIKMRGHCIFWEQQNGNMPSWVPNLSYATYPTSSDLLTEVDERLTSVVTRYKDKFHNWDVDNEMLTDSLLTTRLGSGGIVHMFNASKAIDPNCGMFMNEYSGNSFGGYDSAPYVSRANTLLGLGATIDGYGIQAHVNSPFQPENYWTNVLKRLGVQGKPIWATEFDTDTTNDTQRATDLYNFYLICFSDPNVAGIMQWGFMVGTTWRASGQWGIVSSSGTLNAAGIAYEALLNRWTTHDTNTTPSTGKVNFRGFHGTYEIALSKAGETTEVHTIQLDPNTTTTQITINTNFAAGPPDTTPPTPNPMTWATVPTATGPSSITMTATTATDTATPVQYYFECTTDGDFNSTWQSSTTYVASGLNASTQYSFRVKARDNSANHNETGWSSTLSATTNPPDTTPPTPNPTTWSTTPTATGAYSITMTATTAADATTPPVQYYFECTTDGTKSSGWQSSSTYLASGLAPETLYTFRVKARDSALALNETGWSSSLSATTSVAPINIEILGSWLTGTTHAKGAGVNRALIFIAHDESATGNPSLTSVTYGGQAMTKVIEISAIGSPYGNYVAAFILNESGVAAAASGTFTPTWSTTPGAAAYTSVFLQNVDQTTLVGASDSAGTTSGTDPISTDPLVTNNGDMVILGATCSALGTYTLGNSFTEGTDQQFGDATTGGTGVTGYKAATGASETPNANFSATVGRQCIIGFVVKAGTPVDTAPAAPTGLAATADNHSISLNWNDNTEADMNGYNVYRSTTQGSSYVKLNSSLLTSSDYIDNGLTNGIPYYYVVTAVDDANRQSGNSSEATATPNYQTCEQAIADGHRLAIDISGTGDCYVNYEDLATLVQYWLNTDCVSPDNCHGADFAPTDGTVDFLDFSDFAPEWMQCNNPQDIGCVPNW